MAKKSKFLFLDRDGVINTEGGYLTEVANLEIIKGVPKAIANLRKWFDRVVVVTNQQGIGKGLMNIETLIEIHKEVDQHLFEADTHIDHYFFSPFLAYQNPSTRKPNIGMALQAKEKFPEIIFHHSWMVGDSFTDLEFGKRLGMTTVYIGLKAKWKEVPKGLADFTFESLVDLSLFLESHFAKA